MQGWERQKPKTINEKMGMGPVLFGTCPHFYFKSAHTVETRTVFGSFLNLSNDRLLAGFAKLVFTLSRFQLALNCLYYHHNLNH